MKCLYTFRSSAFVPTVVVGMVAGLLLGGCVSQTVRSVDMTPPQQAESTVPENMLLDVGVAVFDPNVPEDYDKQIEENIAPEVRRAESNYIAYYLKNLLQSTGNWGAVRVVPRATNAVDLIVSGSILHSDGERLELAVAVTDAGGRVWFSKSYKALASKYAYDPSVPANIDPFQSLYRRVADDMAKHLHNLDPDQIIEIRRIAEMKFARDFSPDAFAEHVAETRSGETVLLRLPAENDPMLGRVRKVREREYVFIDTLDEYFAEFHASMQSPYQDWRQATFDEAIARQQLLAQARARTFAGIVGIVAGIAAQTSDNSAIQTAGTIGIIGGAMILKSGLAKRAEAKIHAEVLQELGTSAEAEITPHTMELENQTVRLTGTVDAQYEELRRILRVLYYEEIGLALPEDAQPLPGDSAANDSASDSNDTSET
ncbi:MAG: hypothetical protein E2O54_08080 [Gammaproteobacteria bacterium]|nr:MAG: hypothetical protein E2O54_08080 [Gammaproteobacteria bacterium]